MNIMPNRLDRGFQKYQAEFEEKAVIHANFTWASLISSFIVWIIMTYYFIQDIYDCNGQETIRKKLLIYVGIPLFMMHLLFGIVYWHNQLTLGGM